MDSPLTASANANYVYAPAMLYTIMLSCPHQCVMLWMLRAPATAAMGSDRCGGTLLTNAQHDTILRALHYQGTTISEEG